MIFQNNKSFSDPFPWQMMCAPAVCDFFLRHPRYIQVGLINIFLHDFHFFVYVISLILLLSWIIYYLLFLLFHYICPLCLHIMPYNLR